MTSSRGPAGVPALAGVLLVLALLAACTPGRSTRPRGAAPATSAVSPPTSSPTPQLEAVGCGRALSATFTRGTRAHATATTADVTTGYTACSYRARRSATGSCTAASVTVDTAPQALTDFNRWVDETVQNASAGSGPGLAPQQIHGIGLLADWVPGTLTFETATPIRWVAVHLTCPADGHRRLGLAEALARAALAAT